jgi:tetratricopeptide (TPR) repeat protein
MELVRGRSLQERLTQEGTLPLAEALQVGAALAEALEHAHTHGVLHRDVKPDNVMLREGGAAVLVDFGLAGVRHASRLTQTGQMLGTPGYWAPEQALGKWQQIGPGSDVYALGATLYAMLTGRPPYEPRSYQDLARLLEQDPPPPSSLRAEVPEWLDVACLTCLARDPADRYRSAGTLAAELRSLDRSAVGAVRGRRGGAGLVLGGALALAMAAVGWVAASSDAAPEVLADGTQVTGGPSSTAPIETSSAGPPSPPGPPPVTPLGPELVRADELLRSDPPRARTLLQRLSAEHPGSAAVWALRSVVTGGFGQLDESLEEARRAVELDPTLGAAHAALGLAHQRRGEWRQSVDAAEQALALGQADAETLNQLGFSLQSLEEHEQALEPLRRAILADPLLLPAYINLSTGLLQLGLPQEALRVTRQGLDLEDNELAYQNQSEALLQLGRLEEAELACDRGLALNPASERLRHQRGFVRLMRGAMSAAIADFERLLTPPTGLDTFRQALAVREGAPDDPNWWVAMAARAPIPLVSFGDLTRALTVDPDHIDALEQRALLCRGALDFDWIALADYEALTRLLGDSAALRSNRAAVFQSLGRLEDARAELQAGLGLDPQHVPSLVNMSLCHAELGDLQAALEVADQAVALAPEHPAGFTARANALEQLGRVEEALRALGQAIEADPRYPQAYARRAELLRALGRDEEAARDAERARQHGGGQ